MIVMRLALIAFLYSCSVTFLYAQNLGFSLPQGKRKIQIPFEVHNNLIVVPVVLNHALPLKFIVDTGVRTAILTQKTFTDILGLTYARKYSISGPGGERLVDAYVVNNVSLSLPGIESKGHAMLVLEDDYLELRNYLGTDVHGILGYELFSRFVVEFNYEKKILTLYDPARFHKKRRFQKLPMKIEDTKPYIITPVTLEDGTVINAKLLMDSGASHGLLLDPSSDHRIKIPQHIVSSIIGRGLGGEIRGKVGRVSSVELGSFKLNNVIVTLPDPNSYSDTLKNSVSFRNGTLGGDIMSRFTLAFNFSQEEVYFKKNSDFKKDFYYNLSGITLKAKGAQLNVFEITEVRKQSSAEKAGVQTGDVIHSINGISSPYLDFNLVHALLNSKPNKKVKVEIIRGADRIKIDFLLEDVLRLEKK